MSGTSPTQKKQKGDSVNSTEAKGAGDGAGGSNVAEIMEQFESVQSEIDKLNENASEEILKVEQKYNKLRAPVLSRRGDLLAQIPNFWFTVLVNHPQIGSLLTEKDEQLLQHLKKLELTEFDDIKSGFRISFHMEKNPFFTNEVVWREVHMTEGGDAKATCSKVDWLPGKDLTKKRGGTAAGQKRGHEERDEEPLFAMLLDDSQPHDQSVDDIAEIIKDDIWPNPMQYFISEGEPDDTAGDADDDDVDDEDGDGEEAEGDEDAEEGLDEEGGDDDDDAE